MFEKCLSCSLLGTSCNGPNFFTASASEMLDWCKERKARLGLTNAKISDLSGVPKGTVDRLFAGEHVDAKFETVRPIVKCLVGGEFDVNTCIAPDRVQMEHQAEIIEQQQILIQKLEEEKARLIDVFENQLRIKTKYIVVLGSAFTVTLLIIIVALIIDRLNPDLGFFWRFYDVSSSDEWWNNFVF